MNSFAPLHRRTRHRLFEDPGGAVVHAIPGRPRRRSDQGRADRRRRRHPPLAALRERHRHGFHERQPQQGAASRSISSRRPASKCAGGSPRCPTSRSKASVPAWRSGSASGYEDLKAINPRIVYCSISGYGTVGPMREGKGYDVILQSFTGMLSITGEPGGNPVRSPFSPVDQGTGLHAVIGILGGLLECKRTGHGVKVEASLFDTAVSFLGYFLQGYWQRGTEPQRPGSGHESLCPYQAFETARPSADPRRRQRRAVAIVLQGRGRARRSPTCRSFARAPIA